MAVKRLEHSPRRLSPIWSGKSCGNRPLSFDVVINQKELLPQSDPNLIYLPAHLHPRSAAVSARSTTPTSRLCAITWIPVAGPCSLTQRAAARCLTGRFAGSSRNSCRTARSCRSRPTTRFMERRWDSTCPRSSTRHCGGRGARFPYQLEGIKISSITGPLSDLGPNHDIGCVTLERHTGLELQRLHAREHKAKIAANIVTLSDAALSRSHDAIHPELLEPQAKAADHYAAATGGPTAGQRVKKPR